MPSALHNALPPLALVFVYAAHVCVCVCNGDKCVAHLLIELVVILDHQFLVVHL